MAIRSEQVEPPVVVVVEEGGAPTQERNGRFGNAHLERHVGEVAVAIVVVERFVIV